MNRLTQPLRWPDAAALQAMLRRWQGDLGTDCAVWPAAVRWTAAAALCVLGAWGAWWWGPWPTTEETAALAQTHQTLQAQLRLQQSNVVRLAQQMPSNADPHQALSQLQQAWPTARQAQTLFAAVYRQAQDQGLQVESFKPEAVRQVRGLMWQPLGLRLRGSFAQVVAWSEGLWQQDALWVPEKWLMTAQASDQVMLDAELHLYLRAQDAEAVASEAGTAAPFSLEALQTEPRTHPFAPPQVLAETRAQPEVLGDEVPALQRWPVHSLKMVGSFVAAGHPHALVQTPVGLFQVGIGQRLGAEGGRIVSLDEQQLQVRVVDRDAGRASERLEVLALHRTDPP